MINFLINPPVETYKVEDLMELEGHSASLHAACQCHSGDLNAERWLAVWLTVLLNDPPMLGWIHHSVVPSIHLSGWQASGEWGGFEGLTT